MPKHLELSNLYEYDDVSCPSDWKVDEESSQYHRLYYCYSGEVTYESAAHKIKLKNNTLYLFPILKPYHMTHNPEKPLKCAFAHMTLNNLVLNDIIEISIRKDSVEEHAVKIFKNWIGAKKSKPNIINALNILISVIEEKRKLNYIEDERINSAISFMKANYYEKITNEKLARQINIDHRYFIRIFKANCGCTPQKYLSEYRAFQASRLLAKNYNVNEVAKMVGYDDAKSFSRFFKSVTSKTPSEYKKSYYLQP